MRLTTFFTALAVTAPAKVTKAGFIFKGWSVEIPGTMPAKDLTIKAVWEADPTARIPGDANNDSKVTVADVLLIQQKPAKWNVTLK